MKKKPKNYLPVHYNAGLRKILKIMKITLLLLMLGLSNIYGFVFSQSLMVDLNLNNVSLMNAFESIESKTNIKFLYRADLIDIQKTINLDVKEITLDDLMKELLKDTKISYSILNDNLIVLTPFQQQMISGKVTDNSTGEPIPGVYVIIEGTNTGTVTGNDGRYSLEVPDQNAVLVFSFVGYNSERITVAGRTIIDLPMVAAVQTIEEVVVVGYGTQRKRDLTGAIVSLKSDNLGTSSAPGIGQALQGKAAGVSVTSNSGSPGAETSIRIRGTGSIYSGNEPLYVVDGFPVGSSIVNLINPSDVESIEILKDASSAAIYGSRGANGVILITTKRGITSPPQVSYDAYYGTKKIPHNLEVGDAAQFIQVYLLGRKAAGATENDIVEDFRPYYSLLDGIDFTQDYGTIQRNLYNQIKEDYPNTTNWWDALIQKGIVQNHNLAINGGSERFKYASSVNYYDEDGTIKASYFKRLSFRLNTDYIISKRFKASTNFTISNTKRKASSDAGEDNAIARALNIDQISPITRTREETLLAGGDPENPYDLYSPSKYITRTNPVAAIARYNGVYTQLQILGNGFIDYTILDGLAFRSTFGIRVSRGVWSNFEPKYFISTGDRRNINKVTRSLDMLNAWNWINQLTYSKEIGKHSFTAMVAIDATKSSGESFGATGQNSPSNDVNLRYFNLAFSSPTVNSDVSETAISSYIGRLNYVYFNKYYLTATYRRDGSSNFAEGHRWGNFSSFSLAYRLSEETFFKNMNIKAINNLKIRAGWGQLGNSNIPAYSYLSQYIQSRHISYPFGLSVPYTGGSTTALQSLSQGILPSIIGNPQIKWETQEQKNIGFDMDLLSNRISLTADYFIRTTIDNLIKQPIPKYTGYPSIPWSNNGEIENHGFEFTIEYRDKIGDFSYNLGGNISFIKNKVLSLGQGGEILGGINRISGNGTVTRVGYSMADFIGYKTDGIFQTQEEIDNHVGSNGSILQPYATPGDFRFVNANNDDALDDSDRIILGSPLPKITYGFNIDLSYKGFDLTMFFQGQQGNKILMFEKYDIYTGQGNTNAIKDLPDIAWHGPGTSNTQPRITNDDANLNFRMSDYYLEDGSYTRLKAIQLGYNLPTSLCNAVKINSVKIYVSGENLLTFTKYPGIEPELAPRALNDLGISYYEYPQPRTYLVGLIVGF